MCVFVCMCVTIILQELFRPWVVCNASWHGVCAYECVCVSVIRAGVMMRSVTVGTRGQGFIRAWLWPNHK